MPILGMVVALNTFDAEDAGTDDEVYLGLYGHAGGREFPLSAREHEDFDRGAQDLYLLGVDPGFGFPPIRPDRSRPGEANDPALLPIELDSLRFAYLRKQAYGTGEDDDAWQLRSAVVLLYDSATLPLPRNRMFSIDAPKGLWLGNEHGHQVWLTEFRMEPRGARALAERLGPKTFGAD